MNYNLKGLFIKEDEPASKKVQTVKPAEESALNFASTMTEKSNLNQAQTSQQSIVSSVSADMDIVSKIWEMVVAKNLPGPDYIEFKNAAAGLVDITPDESMQMKGAFNVLKQSHPDFTKEVILKSIDTYIKIVNEENTRGLNECAKLRQQGIGDKTNEVLKIKEDAAQILEQISQLKAKYDELMNSATKIESEIATTSLELANKENVFKASVQNVLDTLSSDKEKVNNLNI